MKIIVIGPAYPLRGGIADTNESMTRAFADAGHDIKIFSFKFQYPKLLFPGKTQYSTDPRPEDIEIESTIHSLNPLNWVLTSRRIKSENPDLVIIRYWIPFLAPSLGTIAGRLRNSCLVIGLCDNIIPHERRFGDHSLTKYFIKRCQAFITLSKKVNEELKQFTKKPSIIIPHPINNKLGEVLDMNFCREKLKLNRDGKYLLFFGLVRKYKGLSLLLDALSKTSNKSIKLIVAGEFYDDISIYLRQIENLGLKERVIITDRYISASEVPLYFGACDLVTQTYLSASQSGITQMAFHFERPILVTDVGGLSEIIQHDVNGKLVVTDPDEIANEIEDFFNRNLFDSMRKKIHSEKAEYSWENFVQKTCKFVEECSAGQNIAGQNTS